MSLEFNGAFDRMLDREWERHCGPDDDQDEPTRDEESDEESEA